VNKLDKFGLLEYNEINKINALNKCFDRNKSFCSDSRELSSGARQYRISAITRPRAGAVKVSVASHGQLPLQSNTLIDVVEVYDVSHARIRVVTRVIYVLVS